jgi:hypothetical protein
VAFACAQRRASGGNETIDYVFAVLPDTKADTVCAETYAGHREHVLVLEGMPVSGECPGRRRVFPIGKNTRGKAARTGFRFIRFINICCQ